MTDGVELIIFGSAGDTVALEGSVDVEIRLPDGRRYAATFFTLQHIADLMQTYRHSGECLSGRFFWATDLILSRP